MLYNMTGAQASLDAPSANGAKLAAKEINAAGGVLGKKIELVAFDGKTDAATIGNSATQLAQTDKVVAMFGFSDSDMTMAAAPTAAKAGVVFVTSGATSPKLPDQVPDYLYLACFGDNVQAAAAAEYAVNTLKAKSVYLLIDKGMEYTLLLGKYFKERFVELGGKVVLEDNYQTGDKDFSAQITKLKGLKAKPDLLFISSGPDDVGTIVKQVRDAGITQPIMGGDGYDTPLLVEVAGAGAENVYFTTHSLMDADLGTRRGEEVHRRLPGRVQEPARERLRRPGLRHGEAAGRRHQARRLGGPQGHPHGPAGHQGPGRGHRRDQLPAGQPHSPEGRDGHPGEGRQVHPGPGSGAAEGPRALSAETATLKRKRAAVTRSACHSPRR